MRKRIAVIDKEKCHPQECGNYLCAKLCPVNRAGADCIYPGDDTKARIDEVLCTGCGICPNRCPFGAITIINLPAHLNIAPVHRYGENQFELYSLPTPMAQQVTGILGKNGIGKSTALKILGNMLKPNLGKWEDPATFDEVITYFRGTEMQGFLTKLHKQETKLSYKPQQVDLIPKQYSGTVRSLLEKIDVQALNDVAQKLAIDHILENDIGKLSGGELQRVAIAAASLKDANLYLFDEPTSYLDIRQRINVSKFIRSLAHADTSTIVIEHDLVILDYMTDMIHLMYGFEGVFGVVSGRKSAREGINAFLDGFLREENVRFRDHSISFENSQERTLGAPVPLLSWNDLRVTLGAFTLQAQKGTLHKNRVIGVLGENGIGKTSFIKVLAGLYKPDTGKLSSNVKVAYKPQYLDTDSETTVLEFLSAALSYERQLIKPLDLEKLYGQPLCELSGGQLQRVAIAHCLAQDADVFLLDEPAAYLDVEQRLKIAKVIKNITAEREVTLLIVDHDLMFLDYLADEVIVFTGTPGKQGKLEGPFARQEGMNMFLQSLGITLRRDVGSHRPRINKEGSVKDREQRASGKWYGG